MSFRNIFFKEHCYDKIFKSYQYDIFENYSSIVPVNMENGVLAGGFCKDASASGIFAIGLDNGSVVVGNAIKANKSYSQNCLYNELSCHETYIREISFIKDDLKFISISTEDPVRVRDINTKEPLETYTTNISLLKCLAVNPVHQNVFIVGGRDNKVAIFDIRCSQSVLSRNLSHHENNNIKLLSQPHWQYRKNCTSSKKLISNDPKHMILSTLSAILFLNEWQFVTGSSLFSTGIRCWDIRSLPQSNKYNEEPLFKYKMPTTKRDYGIAYMAIDPKRANFYAACTNNEIYMYSSDGAYEGPMYTLINTTREGINYSSRLSISPTSDHLTVGTNSDCIKVFDLSSLFGGKKNGFIPTNCTLPYAKYELQGHDVEANVVNYSIDGKYIMTGSSSNFRVWEYGLDKNFITTGEEFDQAEKPVRINKDKVNSKQPQLKFPLPISKLGLHENQTTSCGIPMRKNANQKRKVSNKKEDNAAKKSKFYSLFN